MAEGMPERHPSIGNVFHFSVVQSRHFQRGLRKVIVAALIPCQAINIMIAGSTRSEQVKMYSMEGDLTGLVGVFGTEIRLAAPRHQ